MLSVIFIEMFIAILTVFGGALLLLKYLKEKRLQDLYVFIVLAMATVSDISMFFSQIAFNMQNPFASLGLKIFLCCVTLVTIIVWFHLANIYGVRSRLVSVLISLISFVAAVLFGSSKVTMTVNQGVIVPAWEGQYFNAGLVLLVCISVIGALISIFGLKKVAGEAAERYRISKIAGMFMAALFLSLIIYLMTSTIYLYVLMWFFALLAMLFMFLFSIIPSDISLVRSPLKYFRTHILFKLVITLVIMVIISLQGMAIVSISISKKALSESVIESYKRVAEDTINMISSSRIDVSSEQNTLKSVAKILEKTKIGDRGSVFLVSPTKNIFIERSGRWISLGASESPEMKKVFSGDVGGGDIDVFGERVIAAYIPITKIGWKMIVGQPVDYAYARIKQMESTSVIFVFVWIGLTLIVGTIFSKTIENPIKTVKEGIKKIGHGDLNYKIKISNVDEIGDLASAFNKMTVELKDYQECLLRAERCTVLGQMAAGMAYEIKNALVPLKTLTDMIRISGRDEQFIKKFNELVPHEIDRINRLSTDLLDYAKPGAVKFEHMNINRIVERAKEYMNVRAGQQKVSINLDLKSANMVKVDKQNMLQVFTNLLSHSMETLEDEGGSNIWISSRDEGDKVIVEVADDGPGVQEDRVSKVFVPFYTSKKEGTGMGLAVVQRIVVDHGGKIELVSRLGKGAKFVITLPVVEE